MAVFSVNQNRQMYVLQSNDDVVVKQYNHGTEPYISITMADTVVDDIPLNTVTYVKNSGMGRALQQKVISFTLPGGKNLPSDGSEFTVSVSVVISDWIGQGAGHQLVKKVTKTFKCQGQDTGFVVKSLADALTLQFSSELSIPLTFKQVLFNDNKPSILIKEGDTGDWKLGLYSDESIPFQVSAYCTAGDTVIWRSNGNQDEHLFIPESGVTSEGDVIDLAESEDYVATHAPSTTDFSLTVIPNGRKLAELEYFSKGERGDQYRMKGFPNYIPTKYDVVPTQSYTVFDIHYAYTDEGTSSYRSEKEMTFIIPDSVSLSDKTGLGLLMGILNGAGGGKTSSGSEPTNDPQNPDEVAAH